MQANIPPVKIHWMRHDLRVHGNQALYELCADENAKVLVVYVFDPSDLKESAYGFKPLGKFRQAFLNASLQQVKEELDTLNIQFLSLQGEPLAVMDKLITQLKVEKLSVEHHAGYNERLAISRLQNMHPTLAIKQSFSNTLFSPKQLPFEIADMPDVFSPFRRKIEKNYSIKPPCNTPNKRKQVDTTQPEGITHYDIESLHIDNGYEGGYKGAINRISQYFYADPGLARYKETRNGLDGWDFSSRLSAYLAMGCISPREVYSLIKQYEAERGANDSSYWLFFELLWREFFHWQACKQGAKFFRFKGIQADVNLSNKHDPVALQKWIQGETGYAIVDACMKQIAQTGWMSNRGRQLVASCFVHELNLDWRYGAAYFEQQLVDFDVASNYGNWLYLAGVGSDPRGHRQFNLAKQTEIYDPRQEFIDKWLN